MRDGNKLLAEKYLEEISSQRVAEEIIDEFVAFAVKELGISGKIPEIIITPEPDFAYRYKTYGMASRDKIIISSYGRAIGDVLRTLGHELAHARQFETGEPVDGKTGSKDENEANSVAGVLLRVFGHKHPHIYDFGHE